MKKTKIILTVLSIFLVICIAVGVVVYNAQHQKIERLNTCYEYISDTKENGFDKESASEQALLFKEVLENGITEREYKKSMFCNSNLTFAESLWNCPENRNDLNIAHCRDLILAMYLGCVLETEPEKLSEEFELFKDCVWQLDPKPEFLHLLATKYKPSKTDMDAVVSALIEFSETIEHPLDKYHTRAFVLTVVQDYNENHKDDVYVLKNEKKFIKENIAISEEINKEDFATIWVGYGKVIRLEEQGTIG